MAYFNLKSIGVIFGLKNLNIHLRKKNTGQQALPFPKPDVWTKVNLITQNLKTRASFTHTLERKISSKLWR